MKQDGRWLPRSPLGWALGFSGTVLLFASVHGGERPTPLTITTVEPKITTVTVRPVVIASSPFVSETVCLEALRTERGHMTRIAQSGSQISLYHCERMAENDTIEMVSTPTVPRFR
jgi:hypothetical protein